MTSESDKEDASIAITDDPFYNVDLVEVDDLINSATRLLDEVFGNRPMPPPSTRSPREDAMTQVQRFLSSIRESESPGDDDVVFVEARPGNAPPSNARTTAIVDLCTPQQEDSPPTTRRRRRRTATEALVPQALFQDSSTPDCSQRIPAKCRRRQPKKEPGTGPPSVDLDDSVTSDGGSTTSPSDAGAVPRLICAICMANVVNRQPSSTSCGHIFCQSCILQAIRLTSKCPLCNSKLRRTQVHRVYF